MGAGKTGYDSARLEYSRGSIIYNAAVVDNLSPNIAPIALTLSHLDQLQEEEIFQNHVRLYLRQELFGRSFAW